jgi:hypothetical protein
MLPAGMPHFSTLVVEQTILQQQRPSRPTASSIRQDAHRELRRHLRARYRVEVEAG